MMYHYLRYYTMRSGHVICSVERSANQRIAFCEWTEGNMMYRPMKFTPMQVSRTPFRKSVWLRCVPNSLYLSKNQASLGNNPRCRSIPVCVRHVGNGQLVQLWQPSNSRCALESCTSDLITFLTEEERFNTSPPKLTVPQFKSWPNWLTAWPMLKRTSSDKSAVYWLADFSSGQLDCNILVS